MQACSSRHPFNHIRYPLLHRSMDKPLKRNNDCRINHILAHALHLPETILCKKVPGPTTLQVGRFCHRAKVMTFLTINGIACCYENSVIYFCFYFIAGRIEDELRRDQSTSTTLVFCDIVEAFQILEAFFYDGRHDTFIPIAGNETLLKSYTCSIAVMQKQKYVLFLEVLP